MVKRYCPCGYPMWVRARWTGADVVLLLQDGTAEPTRAAAALVRCPHCHRRLAPAELTWLAPPALLWQERTPAVGPARDEARPQGKILVVDDDEEIRAVLQQVLADAGFQVQGARDGTEALALLHREGGWVVLLDLIWKNSSPWRVPCPGREAANPGVRHLHWWAGEPPAVAMAGGGVQSNTADLARQPSPVHRGHTAGHCRPHPG